VCKAKTHVSSRPLDPVSTQANQDKTKPSLSDDHSEPYQLDVHLNDFPMKMDWTQEQQCRSSTPLCLIISKSSYIPPLQPAESKLKTYTDQDIQALGVTRLEVRYENKEMYLCMHVVSGSGPCLLVDWITS